MSDNQIKVDTTGSNVKSNKPIVWGSFISSLLQYSFFFIIIVFRGVEIVDTFAIIMPFINILLSIMAVITSIICIKKKFQPRVLSKMGLILGSLYIVLLVILCVVVILASRM